MNRREILKSFIALPFISKQITKIPLSSEVLPPTGAAEAINNSLIPNINVTGISSSGIVQHEGIPYECSHIRVSG